MFGSESAKWWQPACLVTLHIETDALVHLFRGQRRKSFEPTSHVNLPLGLQMGRLSRKRPLQFVLPPFLISLVLIGFFFFLIVIRIIRILHKIIHAIRTDMPVIRCLRKRILPTELFQYIRRLVSCLAAHPNSFLTADRIRLSLQSLIHSWGVG